MDTAHNVHHLSHPETDSDAAQRVSIQFSQSSARCQELDCVTRGECHGDVQVFVQSQKNPVCWRFRDGPAEVLLFMENDLDTHLLHARLQGRKIDFAIALHGMRIASKNKSAGLPNWNKHG